MAISRSAVCRKGLCSETTDLKLHTADRTRKNCHTKVATLCVSAAITSTFGSSLVAFSQNWLLGLRSPEVGELPDGTADRLRGRLSTRWHHSLRLGRCPQHRQPLTVVTLLIDASTETHWKPPGTGPTTWTYALLFMHVVPKCTLPHSYIQHHWNHSMVCDKNDLKPLDKYTDVVRLVGDCMK